MSIDTERKGGETAPVGGQKIGNFASDITVTYIHTQSVQTNPELVPQNIETGEEQKRKELWDKCTKNPLLFAALVDRLCDTVASPFMAQQLAAVSKLQETHTKAIKANGERKTVLTQTTAEKIVNNDNDTKERVETHLSQLGQQFQDAVEARLGIEKNELQAAHESSEETAKRVSNVRTVVSNTQVNLSKMRDNTALDNAHHAIDGFAATQIEKAKQLIADRRRTNTALSTLPAKFAEVTITSKELTVVSETPALPQLYNQANSPSDQRMMRARGLAIGVYSWRNTGIIDDNGEPSELAIKNRVRVESQSSELKAFWELTKEYERDQLALQRSPDHHSIFADPNKADEYANALIAVLSARTQELDRIDKRNTVQSKRVYKVIEERFEADIITLQQSHEQETNAYCLQQSTKAQEYTHRIESEYDKEYKRLEDEAAAIEWRSEAEAVKMQQSLSETQKRIETLKNAKRYFQGSSEYLRKTTQTLPWLEMEVAAKKNIFDTISNAFNVLMQSPPENENTQRIFALGVKVFQESRANDSSHAATVDGIAVPSIQVGPNANSLNDQLQILQAMVGTTQAELNEKMQHYSKELDGLHTAASDRTHAFNDFLESGALLRDTEVVRLPLTEQEDTDRFTRHCVGIYEEHRKNKVRGTKATDIKPERAIGEETWWRGFIKAVESRGRKNKGGNR